MSLKEIFSFNIILILVFVAWGREECGMNEIYAKSGSQCKTCENPDAICPTTNQLKCYCKEGYLRSSNGTCLSQEECVWEDICQQIDTNLHYTPCLRQPRTCLGLLQPTTNSSGSCHQGCTCKPGLYLNDITLTCSDLMQCYQTIQWILGLDSGDVSEPIPSSTPLPPITTTEAAATESSKPSVESLLALRPALLSKLNSLKISSNLAGVSSKVSEVTTTPPAASSASESSQSTWLSLKPNISSTGVKGSIFDLLAVRPVYFSLSSSHPSDSHLSGSKEEIFFDSKNSEELLDEIKRRKSHDDRHHDYGNLDLKHRDEGHHYGRHHDKRNRVQKHTSGRKGLENFDEHFAEHARKHQKYEDKHLKHGVHLKHEEKHLKHKEKHLKHGEHLKHEEKHSKHGRKQMKHGEKHTEKRNGRKHSMKKHGKRTKKEKRHHPDNVNHQKNHKE